jgi:protein-tyrosine phosphatase
MNSYIDIHSHILYGIDDGSRSLDESINIIKNMKNIGFNDIIITPHYIEGTSYNCNNFGKKILFNYLKEKVSEAGIDINLYLGNEIFVFDKIKEFLENGEIFALNDSKYLLIETPMQQEVANLDEYLFKLISHGYKVILAHPERYSYFQDDPSKIKKYIDMGVLFQSNYASITGRYGNHAMKTLKYFLKNNYITFLASDIHHENSTFYDDFAKMKKEIIHIVGNETFEKLSYLNAKNIIDRL